MKLKGVVFDMDGTLVDSMSAWEDYKRNMVTAVLGYYEESINVATKTTAEVVNELKTRFNAELTKEDVDGFARRFLKPYYDNEVELKEGVKEFLETLSRNNIKMAIATATRREFFGCLLERLGIYKYFDTVITCNEVGKGKSEPLVFHTAIEKIGCKTDEVYVFEDSLVPMQTCKKAGIRVCGVKEKYNASVLDEILKTADFYVSSFNEFKDKEKLNKILCID